MNEIRGNKYEVHAQTPVNQVKLGSTEVISVAKGIKISSSLLGKIKDLFLSFFTNREEMGLILKIDNKEVFKSVKSLSSEDLNFLGITKTELKQMNITNFATTIVTVSTNMNKMVNSLKEELAPEQALTPDQEQYLRKFVSHLNISPSKLKHLLKNNLNKNNPDKDQKILNTLFNIGGRLGISADPYKKRDENQFEASLKQKKQEIFLEIHDGENSLITFPWQK